MMHSLPSVWGSREPRVASLITCSSHHRWMHGVSLHLPQACYEYAYGMGIC